MTDTSTKRPIIVQKYGGSSLATLEKISFVAQRVAQKRAAGYDLVVVVSAMGDTTDDLLKMAKKLTAAPGNRELDMLLTAGERISMSLMCLALQELGVRAVSLTGSQSGIMTTASHSNARIIEVRPFRIEDGLAEGNVVVVAGYQGVSYQREVTTLGRGGSDTTAVALAAALDAEACEIYSDVDGVYSADPRKVPARHLPEVSYAEMQEMAASGARVLNAQAVEFAKKAGIAIFCRATDDTGRQTVIRKGGYPKTSGEVSGVASMDGLVRIRVTGDENGRSLLGLLEETSCPSRQYVVEGCGAQSRATLFVALENAHRFSEAVERMRRDIPGVDISPQLGAVSLIGETINDSKNNLMQAMRLLQDNRIPWWGIDTTSYRITFMLDEDKLDRVVQLFHKSFIEVAPQYSA
jgi:aspartate kinase